MARWAKLVMGIACVSTGAVAFAQTATPQGSEPSDAAMMTTKHEAAATAPAPLPWQKQESAAPASTPFGTYQPKIPFGRGEAGNAPVVPSGPHTAEAVPVVDVDAVEASEPAPPTPVAPEADPAKEDPAAPTELTSPIFGDDPLPAMPRKIILRALNKVTAQSELMTLKPNETVKFGQLVITAINCRASAAESQTDYAGLFDISEKVPTKEGIKPLFRGWMYASSPSITSLENPVYDVTMVECKMAVPAAKDEPKDEKSGKKGKK